VAAAEAVSAVVMVERMNKLVLTVLREELVAAVVVVLLLQIAKLVETVLLDLLEFICITKYTNK
jgi:hypothetical protein